MHQHPRSLTTKELYRNRSRLARYRRIFLVVIEIADEIKATIGNAPSIDYEDATTGKAKYKNDVSFLRVIDFAIDVENAAKQFIDVKHRPLDIMQPFPSNPETIKLQEDIGRAFVTRKLYPVHRYLRNTGTVYEKLQD